MKLGENEIGTSREQDVGTSSLHRLLRKLAFAVSAELSVLGVPSEEKSLSSPQQRYWAFNLLGLALAGQFIMTAEDACALLSASPARKDIEAAFLLTTDADGNRGLNECYAVAGLLSKAAGCSVTALQVAERVCVKKVGAEARNAGVKSMDASALRELTVLTPSQLKAQIFTSLFKATSCSRMRMGLKSVAWHYATARLATEMRKKKNPASEAALEVMRDAVAVALKELQSEEKAASAAARAETQAFTVSLTGEALQCALRQHAHAVWLDQGGHALAPAAAAAAPGRGRKRALVASSKQPATQRARRAAATLPAAPHSTRAVVRAPPRAKKPAARGRCKAETQAAASPAVARALIVDELFVDLAPDAWHLGVQDEDHCSVDCFDASQSSLHGSQETGVKREPAVGRAGSASSDDAAGRAWQRHVAGDLSDGDSAWGAAAAVPLFDLFEGVTISTPPPPPAGKALRARDPRALRSFEGIILNADSSPRRTRGAARLAAQQTEAQTTVVTPPDSPLRWAYGLELAEIAEMLYR